MNLVIKKSSTDVQTLRLLTLAHRYQARLLLQFRLLRRLHRQHLQRRLQPLLLPQLKR